jgi:DNA primase
MRIRQSQNLDADSIRASVDLLSLAGQDTRLEKVSSIGGGEYAGPCPFCGGEDRFRVQLSSPPRKMPAGQRWFCRQCSPKWGDVIGYTMKRDALTFMDALKTLSGDLASGDLAPRQDREEPEPVNRLQWTETAFEFLATSQDTLFSPEGAGALHYLHTQRGLTDETLKRWGIGYNPLEGWGEPCEWGLAEEDRVFIPKGIVIPCQDAQGLHYVKIRRREGHPKYLMLRGSEVWLYGAQTLAGALTGFLFEGEFDVLLAAQTGYGVGFCGLPAGQELRKEYSTFFRSIENMILALDGDEPGRKAAGRLAALPGFIRADPLPGGHKDLTEYWQSHRNHDLIFEWIYQQTGRSDGLRQDP